MRDFIKNIPKAELHIHIEGALEPELMFTLAHRNRVRLPFDSVAALRSAYAFDNLQSFLDIYYQGTNVLFSEQDFYDLAWAYLEKAREDNVCHAEIFFDPQTHTGRGVGFDTVVRGLHQAMSDAEQRLGISTRLIMCFLRHLSVEAAMLTLRQGLDYKDWITGVGLDSSETGFPPVLFSPVFRMAKESGFLTVAHAGEEGPAEYIRQALDDLGALRIDHGVRCTEDPKLVHRLRKEQIPLTVCPLSNVRLRVFKSIETHNLKQLLEMGLCVNINSDDPAYFGGYIAENYRAAQDGLGLTDDDIRQIAKNSFRASFLEQEAKLAFMRAVDDFKADRSPTESPISKMTRTSCPPRLFTS